MRHFLRKPILSAIVLAWVLISCAVLWSPRESIRHAGSEVFKAAQGVAPSKAPRQLLIFNGDNWHVFLFLGLAVLVTCYPQPLGWKEVLMLMVGLAAFGALTEIVQAMFVPGRAFEWHDMGLNQMGLTAGVALTSMVRVLCGRCFVRGELTSDC